MRLILKLAILCSVAIFHSAHLNASAPVEASKNPLEGIDFQKLIDRELRMMKYLAAISYLINQPDMQRTSDDYAVLVPFINGHYAAQRKRLEEEERALTAEQRKGEQGNHLKRRRKAFHDDTALHLVLAQRAVASLRAENNRNKASEKQKAEDEHAKAPLAQLPALSNHGTSNWGMHHIHSAHNGFVYCVSFPSKIKEKTN